MKKERGFIINNTITVIDDHANYKQPSMELKGEHNFSLHVLEEVSSGKEALREKYTSAD